MIWQQDMNLSKLNQMCQGNMLGYLGIEFIEVGSDYIVATMPVTDKVKQPMGLLHGGASVVLAESLASCAAYCAAAPGSSVVGVEVNANHLNSARSGVVSAKAWPLKLGQRLQVWQIELSQAERAICSARLSVMVSSKS